MPKSNRKVLKNKKKVYLDYASGALPNPGGIHKEGVDAKKRLEKARYEVASILSARPSEVIFTSSGTESNNLAIQGVAFAFNGEGLPHIITTNIEHSSVLETFKLLKKRKLAQITIVPVENNGRVDIKKIKKAFKKNTVLVSINYANSEIGTIQPISEIAKAIRYYKKGKAISTFFHVDAVQAVNYLDLNVDRLGVDLLTLSGVKIEGAGRVGVLYKKKTVPLEPVMGGGDQEGGLRPGTENLSEIIKFASALKITEEIKDKEVKRLNKLRDFFIDQLLHSNVGLDFRIRINGDLENRLPNNINITIPNITSDLLIIELSAQGVYASSKSACKSGDGKASHVISAINKPARNASSIADAGGNINEEDGSIRFSMGRDTTKDDIIFTIKILADILKKLKRWYTPTPI